MTGQQTHLFRIIFHDGHMITTTAASSLIAEAKVPPARRFRPQGRVYQEGFAMTKTTMPDRISIQIGLTADNFTGFSLRKWATEPFTDGTEYVRADLAAQVAWQPISKADNGIAYVHDLAGLRIGCSYPIWVRDADGRTYEALRSDDGKRAYWWDIEGESPVDPVEFMPHPMDPRFHDSSRSAGGRNDG